MSKCEVTQKQFSTVIGTVPADQAATGEDLPVANVTFAQAKDFCDRLSQKDGKHYALPSKDDWLAAAGLTEQAEAS